MILFIEIVCNDPGIMTKLDPAGLVAQVISGTGSGTSKLALLAKVL